MKASTIFLFLFICFPGFAQLGFEKWFTDGSLRLDFLLAGNNSKQEIYIHEFRKEPFYGGSKDKLIDKFQYGDYYFEIYDETSTELIFSRGFNTLFGEWQTTDEAKKENKAFKQSLSFPMPLSNIILKIYKRNNPVNPKLLYTLSINPNDFLIPTTDIGKFRVVDYLINGSSDEKLDILFLAEGYTKEQMDDFLSDVNIFSEYMFTMEPYAHSKDKINIRAICSESDDSGTDIPGDHIWKATAVNSTFYTFGSERYLTTYDYWAVRDIAASAPYDQIVVLVNSEKYGGGGIYNHYSLFSAKNRLSKEVFIHEFGHGFAGLGDEYYTSSTAYSEFYDINLEPWEPNLTTLINFEGKWKDMMDKDTPVPTPAIEEFNSTVGVYEGGGYSAKDIYRPFINCRMKTNTASGFCPVCQRAIQKMIDFYSN
jgi:IgA Peptidase M64/Peptidase M64 N-terminus